MSERANALADALQLATDDVDRFIGEVSDEGWQATCPGEQCTVAALICHIGNAYTGMLDSIIKPVAEGAPRPEFSPEDLHRWNAQAAQMYAGASREQAREILRTASAPTISYVRGLSDEQLATSFDLPQRPEPVTVEAMVIHGLTGHPREHLASARAAAGSVG
ncbi:MAG: DinB family protein [Thermomicrobiales bacterium]|nr:DinB family protein [Thermomicrobiales bacterium]